WSAEQVQHFIAIVISGLNDGCVYALMALGIVLLQNATGVINFAQGDLMTLGAFLGFWWVVQHHGNQVVMYFLTVALLFAAGGVPRGRGGGGWGGGRARPGTGAARR